MTWEHTTRLTIFSFALSCLAWLGNGLHASEAESFPIQGSVPNMQQTTSASGLTLQVNFQQIQYRGVVKDTSVISQNGNEAVVEMELENVVLTIGRTSIKGTLRIGAECGPMQIQLGTQRNLKIRFRTRSGPNGLDVLSTNLRLDPTNWSIGNPSSVRVSGFGVTESRVVSGLKSGLNNNLRSIEGILVDEAPRILQQRSGELLSKLQSNTKLAKSDPSIRPTVQKQATRDERNEKNSEPLVSKPELSSEPNLEIAQRPATIPTAPDQPTPVAKQPLKPAVDQTLARVDDASWKSPTKGKLAETAKDSEATATYSAQASTRHAQASSANYQCSPPHSGSAGSAELTLKRPIRSMVQQTFRLLSFAF